MSAEIKTGDDWLKSSPENKIHVMQLLADVSDWHRPQFRYLTLTSEILNRWLGRVKLNMRIQERKRNEARVSARAARKEINLSAVSAVPQD